MTIDTNYPNVKCRYHDPIAHPAQWQVVTNAVYDDGATMALAYSHWRTCLLTQLLPFSEVAMLSINAGGLGIVEPSFVQLGGGSLISYGQTAGNRAHYYGGFP